MRNKLSSRTSPRAGVAISNGFRNVRGIAAPVCALARNDMVFSGEETEMKIAIIGYSGSGKSTLARKLSEQYELPVLHFDRVQFRPNWEIRPQKSKEVMTRVFLDLHADWVIDGNYSKLYFERRMEEADVIILLLFNKLSCLYRVTRRYRKYKDQSRPDMAEGCKEKLDWEFVKWILRDGRTKESKARYQSVLDRYSEKTIVIKNQRQLNKVHKRINEILSQ